MVFQQPGENVTALPPADPAYADVLDVLSRHGGEVVTARPEIEGGLFSDLLDVIVEDRVRSSGPGDISNFFDSLTAEQRVELDDSDETMPPSVWVRSDVSPTGVYIVTIDYSSDHSRTLAPSEVGPYIDAFTMAVVYAEYDAAAINQLRAKLPPGPASDQAIGQILLELRGNRLPVDHKALKPLIVRSCVSASTGLPYVTVRVAGTKLKWQWDPAEVIEHTQYVRETLFAADMDATYRRFLVSNIGLDKDTATAMVGDLRNWRHPRA